MWTADSQKAWTLICGFNSLHSSQDLLPFSHRSIYKVQHDAGWWLTVGVHPKRCWMESSVQDSQHETGKAFLHDAWRNNQTEGSKVYIHVERKRLNVISSSDFPPQQCDCTASCSVLCSEIRRDFWLRPGKCGPEEKQPPSLQTLWLKVAFRTIWF